METGRTNPWQPDEGDSRIDPVHEDLLATYLDRLNRGD